jgi:hypothetical protein
MNQSSPDLSAWKRSLADRGLDADAITELESYLIEAITRLRREQNLSETQAFAIASERLGSPDALAREFRKTSRLSLIDRAVLTGVLALAVSFFGLIVHSLLNRLDGQPGESLRGAHIVSLSLGYLIPFVFSFLGAYSLARPLLCGSARPRWQRIFHEIMRYAGPVGLLATLLGTVFGALWAGQTRGAYWSWDASEVGALLLLTWYLVVCLPVARKPVPSPRLPLVAITGGATALYAWFGVNGLSANTGFLLFAGLHVALMLWALKPRSNSGGGPVIA